MTSHISEKELAKRWDISRRTLQRWRKNGDSLAYLQVGGCIRYPIELVHEFEAKHTIDATGKFVLPASLLRAPAIEGDE